MQRRALAACVSIVLSGGICGCGGGSSIDGAGAGSFDGDRAFDDLVAQVEIGPRPSGSAGSREEVRLIVDRLRDDGLVGISVQRPLHNVLATIPGTKPGVIVLGAHYDTKNGIPGFVGANDGASGVAVLLELARSFPARVEGPAIQLVFFDGEEARGDRDFDADGTRGSRQYVAYAKRGARQGSAALERIKAMVLYDMVGDCDLQVPYEGLSDVDLYAAFADAAKELNGSGDSSPFKGTAAGGVLDDHTPFRKAGIPALDLIDFDYGPGPSPGEYWHTDADDLDQVCPGSLDAIGESSLPALRAIGRKLG